MQDDKLTAKDWFERWIDNIESRVGNLEKEMILMKLKIVGYSGLAGGIVAGLLKITGII